VIIGHLLPHRIKETVMLAYIVVGLVCFVCWENKLGWQKQEV
jgi:hypothetical protein